MQVDGANSNPGSFSDLQQASSQGSTNEFNTFLTLLTAQIRNQDPLAPLDSTQFVEQLATFSSLEQQVRTNDQLEAISLMLAEMRATSAGEWVGEEAEVTTSWLPYSGGEVTFNADIPAEATRAVMVLRDSSGDVIDSMGLEEEGPWVWDGRTSSNQQAEDGLYQMLVELYTDGEPLGVMEPRIVTKVTQASVENGKTVLGFENRMTALATDVRKAGK